MYRRIVSFLLLPCVLLTQSVAAFGHSHGSDEPAGSRFRAHFHTHHAACRHEQAHHHHGQDVHHHSNLDGHAVAEQDSRLVPWFEGEHDSDAVYIDGKDLGLCRRSTLSEELAGSLFSSHGGLHPSVALCAQPPKQVLRCAHSPPLSSCHCAIYVWQRALLL